MKNKLNFRPYQKIQTMSKKGSSYVKHDEKGVRHTNGSFFGAK